MEESTPQTQTQTPAPAPTQAQAPAFAPATATPATTTENDKTLYLIAFILNIVSTASVGWLLIPLAWMLPMTIISYGIYKGTKKNTTAFGVCTLVFLNLVSGILLLVAKKED